MTFLPLSPISHIRAVCFGCGWHRYLGYCGPGDVSRRVVRFRKARSTCNLVECLFRDVAADLSPEDIEKSFPGFSDLTVTWDPYSATVANAKTECQRLLEDLPCPRCKKSSKNLAIQLRQPYTVGFVCSDSRFIPSWAKLSV